MLHCSLGNKRIRRKLSEIRQTKDFNFALEAHRFLSHEQKETEPTSKWGYNGFMYLFQSLIWNDFQQLEELSGIEFSSWHNISDYSLALCN